MDKFSIVFAKVMVLVPCVFVSFSFFGGHQTFLFKISKFKKSPHIHRLRGENHESYNGASIKAYLLLDYFKWNDMYTTRFSDLMQYLEGYNYKR